MTPITPVISAQRLGRASIFILCILHLGPFNWPRNNYQFECALALHQAQIFRDCQLIQFRSSAQGDSLSLASVHLLVVLRRLHLRRLHPARALIGPDRAHSSCPGPLWTLHAFREAKSIPVATEGALLAHLHTCSFAVIPYSTRDTKSSIACPINRLVGSKLTSCARRLVCGRHFLAVLPRTALVASQQRGSSLSRAPCSRRTVCTSQWCCGTSCRTPFPSRARLTDLRCFCPALSTPSAFGTHFTRCRS